MFFDVRNKPNRARIFFDGAISLAAAVFAFAFWRYVVEKESQGVVLLAPFLLVIFNAIVGVYSRFRISSGKVKLIAISVALVATSATLLLVNELPGVVLLWATLAWAPLVLPRIFLNFNRRSSSGLISSVVREKGPVLIVGGAGYIGSVVLERLVKEGARVRILDKFLYGHDSTHDLMNHPNVEFVDGDVTDLTKLTEAMYGASSVVHLAGLVGDPACAVDESFTRHTNVIATRMIKEVGISMGVKRFIFASSCSVYGASDEKVSELSKLNPVSLYARTKIDSEEELNSLIDENFCVTILRFATVFGHSRRPRFDLVANLFTAQALNDGVITVMGADQWRPFVHVQDLARSIISVLKADVDKVYRQTFNVGDESLNMTIGDLAETIKEVVSKIRPVEIVVKDDVGDRRNYIVSFDKIQRTLGFRASVSVRAGIEEMVREFDKGTYRNFREAIYSNLEMTKQAVVDFHNPDNLSRLYGPLSDDMHGAKGVVNF